MSGGLNLEEILQRIRKAAQGGTSRRSPALVRAANPVIREGHWYRDHVAIPSGLVRRYANTFFSLGLPGFAAFLVYSMTEYFYSLAE